MIQSAIDAAKKVADLYAKSGIGSYLLLRGEEQTKAAWVIDFRKALTEENEELSESTHSGSISREMVYGGDVINFIINARTKVYINYTKGISEYSERQHRAISVYFGFQFILVDEFLSYAQLEANPPRIPASKYNPYLPNAIIVDLDGTLADSSHRKPYGASPDEIMNDGVITHVQTIVTMYATYPFFNAVKVLYTTGRGESWEEIGATSQWLQSNISIPPGELLHRQPGDTRSDQVVKLELYNNHIRDKYNVVLVLDDRPKVVRMWHELGLPVLANKAYVRGEF